MSGRARDRAPRSSTSPPPSVASSSTVSSRLVRKSQEVGGPVGIAGRKQSPGRLARQITPAQNDEQYLQARGYLDNNATNGSPRHQQRKSGGFLLEPAFNAKQYLPAETYRSSYLDKGKARADGRLSSGDNSVGAFSSRKLSNGADVGSPDARDSGIGQSRHSNSGEYELGRMNGVIETSKREYSRMHETNATGDLKGMRKTRENTDTARYGGHAAPSRQSGMDPAEIVSMALNLSESRRRHLSAGKLASTPFSSGRRVASAGIQQPNLPLQGSYRSNESGNLLQQHLQRQLLSERGVSRASGRPTSYASNGSDMPAPADLPSEPPSILDQPVGYGFHFSAGTISRAEKARKAIELSLEFRRFLQFLPPLQPDSRTHTSEQRPLGRAYNPLQLIRNRKVRARERKQLDPDVDAWDNVDAAKCWIDVVEAQIGNANYRIRDSILLPNFNTEMNNKAPGEQQNRPTAKAKRTRLDWTFSPCEALADAYWLEQSDNKASIEDRHGHKMFPGFKPPSVNNVPMDAESIHDPQKEQKHHAELASASSSIASPEAIEETRGRAHKRRNFLHLPINDSHGKFKRRSWHRSPSRSSTSSNLSSSEEEDTQSHKKPTIRVSTNTEGVGPLERHMNTLMQSENAGVPTVSPISPDHWDNQHPLRPIANRFDNNLDSSTTADSSSPRDHRHWPTSKFFDFSKKPKHEVQEEMERQPRSSLDTLDSATPNSPSTHRFIPSISMDLSSPTTGGSASTNKHKVPKLPFFHHSNEKAKHQIESNDFAFSSQEKTVSRLSTDDVRVPNRSSLDVPRPTRLRHVRSQTTDEGSSIRSSRVRTTEKDWNENKEPISAVGRLFKGGRIGDLVRSEGSRLSDRIRKSDSVNEGSKASGSFIGLSDVSSDTSSDEDEMLRRGPKPRPFPASEEVVDNGGRVSQDSRRQYHMTNLPAFKHSSTLEREATADSTSVQNDDPISTQQRTLREGNQSQRFNRLAPPKIDLSNISRSSSPGPSRTGKNDGDTDRDLPHERRSSFGSKSRSRSPAREHKPPNGSERAGRLGSQKPPSSLSKVPAFGPEISRSRSGTRPQLNHRHWSISDQPQESRTSVNRREIARMETLFLSSGIKAKEITHRALTARRELPDFLVKAAEIANTRLYPVARKEEHVLAARMLSTHLEKTTKEIENGIQRFHDSDVQSLRTELQDVRIKIADELTPLVFNKADEADSFTAELTSRHTLDIKQLNDYVELMKRRRRRRLRWLRRAGFTLLEWMLLGFMWWVWLIVVVIRSIRTVVMGVVNVARWIVWL